jgi:hypothetical protein
MDDAFSLKNAISITFKFDFASQNFFGCGENVVCHSDDSRLVSGS